MRWGGGGVQNVDASAYLRVFMCVCVCAVEQRASVPPWLQRWCCKPEQENKLESQEEMSFMSDALIRKTTRSPQSSISWLIFLDATGDNLTQTIQTTDASLINKSVKKIRHERKNCIIWIITGINTKKRVCAHVGGTTQVRKGDATLWSSSGKHPSDNSKVFWWEWVQLTAEFFDIHAPSVRPAHYCCTTCDKEGRNWRDVLVQVGLK